MIVTDKRNHILASAIKLFAQKGYDGVSVRQIADESGCNLAAVSYYFGGKEKLYEQCISVLDQQKIQEVCHILSEPANRMDFDQKLKLFCQSYSELMVSYSTIVRIHLNNFNSLKEFSPRLENTVFGPVFNCLEAFLKMGMERGIVSSEINLTLAVRKFLTPMIFEATYFGLGKNESNFERFAADLVRNNTESIYA